MNADIREGVRQAYSAAAKNPHVRHPFPLGRQFAESLGYWPDILAGIPAAAVDTFAGVSNVAVFANIPPGATVLDLGCGAGLDSLIAARRVGPIGKVIGVDFSEAMLRRARQAATEAGINNVEFHQAEAANLCLDHASIEVALVNGIFNLNPARGHIFRELARVVRPGGVVYAAELILREPLPLETQADETNWFA
ncbi:MAG: methyltransferase domain-containing protein [Anaerolineae bacterium]|nr:methyltransferase domain-containing protein [Anaerolineae bacterium]